ncbi:hypothetical protein GCM10023153_24670 [Ornithinibacter aureus]|uniref:SF3 helicase domain-containing protein n=2 Tax=Ornithinibacter aureus TaxID=622664 RepID=A0ABP8K1R9_9MICO|nr:P4 family phage/plasmid primase-like protein [Ornithinibacter aureus]
MHKAIATEFAGWPLIEIYSAGPDGTCHCPDGATCTRGAGKHPKGYWKDAAPLTEHGRTPRGLGVRTGAEAGFWVLDVDEAGVEPMKALIAEHGGFPATRKHQTGGGTWHYFFTMPDDFDITCSPGRLPKGVDVRGNGGYVILPPHRSGKGLYTVIDSSPVAPAPGWLLDLLRPKAVAEPVRAADPEQRKPSEASPYETSAIDSEVSRLKAMRDAATPDGAEYKGEPWDATTFEVACKLFELANSDWTALTPDEVPLLVRAEAPRDAGFDGSRVEAKIDSARGKVGAKQRPAPVDNTSWLEEVTPRSGPSALTGRTLDRDEVALTAAGALSDAEQASRFADAELSGRFLHAPGLGWLQWDGRRWADTDESVVVESSRRYAKQLIIDATRRGADPDAIKALTRRLTKNAIRAVVELARGIDGVRVQASALDAHPDLLNVANGVVDLRSGGLRPHDPGLLLTRISPVPYLPDATHPDVSAALQAIPAETREWMQVRFGQAASGHPAPDDIVPITFGGGANGKSSVLGAVDTALGEHSGVVSARLMVGRAGDHPTELMQLRGLRLAISEELPEGHALDTKRLKDVSGTHAITARAIRRDNVSFPATHSLVLSSNYRPKIVDTDHGTWRRLALVTFPWRYAAAPSGPGQRTADQGLRQRLREGLDGQHEAALAWVVEGARRWYAAGRVLPPPPGRVAEDTLAWRRQSDLVLAYVHDRLEFDAAAMVPSLELYADFGDWMTNRGHSRWSEKTFSERFDSHEMVTERNVARARTRDHGGLSRRFEEANQAYAPGQQVRVHKGLRFRRLTEGAR